jgi:hypothetical protein
MHLELRLSDGLDREVIEAGGIVVNETEVPPRHIEIKFL